MTNTKLTFNLHVLLLREGDVWVAQCLDYDIAAQGSTLAGAREAFAKAFGGQVAIDLHHQVEPLQGFSPAPQEYWELFKQADRLSDPQPIYVPAESMPPAFMIHAMANDVRISA